MGFGVFLLSKSKQNQRESRTDLILLRNRLLIRLSVAVNDWSDVILIENDEFVPAMVAITHISQNVDSCCSFNGLVN